MYVAYGKVHGLVTIICVDFIHGFLDSPAGAVFRQKVSDVIYELAADDDFKDDLRKTFTIVPLEDFAHDLSDLSESA